MFLGGLYAKPLPSGVILLGTAEAARVQPDGVVVVTMAVQGAPNEQEQVDLAALLGEDAVDLGAWAYVGGGVSAASVVQPKPE